MLALLFPLASRADTLRIATWHAPLTRDGPGLLLRDLTRDPDPALAHVFATLATTRPDILVLTDFDYDHGHAALHEFRSRLAGAGLALPHVFARRPNTGRATGLDLDRNGRLGEPRDAQGYGRFAGEGGVAVLSRWPFDEDRAVDLGGMLWRDLPASRMTDADTGRHIQRLSTSVHWVLPVDGPMPLSLLVFHATPPVFDGPDDRNGRRNADEVAVWTHLLDGKLPVAAPQTPFVIAGNANADPRRGDGYRDVIGALLNDPRLTDPHPRSAQGGDATVDWSDNGPGLMRVSYLLPSAALTVQNSAVVWDMPQDAAPLRHKLVWLDLTVTPPAIAAAPAATTD